MTAHARGGLFLEPAARAIIDIGALHTRAVRMDERAKVLSYRMTSQCASGSGQFLENIARYLGVALEEIGTLSQQGSEPEACSSICAVLAETDVINMVSRGISIPNILRGIHQSIPGRCVRLLSAARVLSLRAQRGQERPSGRPGGRRLRSLASKKARFNTSANNGPSSGLPPICPGGLQAQRVVTVRDLRLHQPAALW